MVFLYKYGLAHLAKPRIFRVFLTGPPACRPMTLSILRRALALSLLSAPAWTAWAQTSPALLPAARALPDELATALRMGQPLVVMVSLEGCVFCKIARQSHLSPMQRQGQPIVQVDLRSTQPVIDFEGRATTHDELARRWRVSITPTLLFFGARGREVAERMEGAYQPDFYGPYLEDRLSRSRAALKG